MFIIYEPNKLYFDRKKKHLTLEWCYSISWQGYDTLANLAYAKNMFCHKFDMYVSYVFLTSCQRLSEIHYRQFLLMAKYY